MFYDIKCTRSMLLASSIGVKFEFEPSCSVFHLSPVPLDIFHQTVLQRVLLLYEINVHDRRMSDYYYMYNVASILSISICQANIASIKPKNTNPLMRAAPGNLNNVPNTVCMHKKNNVPNTVLHIAICNQRSDNMKICKCANKFVAFDFYWPNRNWSHWITNTFEHKITLRSKIFVGSIRLFLVLKCYKKIFVCHFECWICTRLELSSDIYIVISFRI